MGAVIHGTGLGWAGGTGGVMHGTGLGDNEEHLKCKHCLGKIKSIEDTFFYMHVLNFLIRSYWSLEDTWADLVKMENHA